jgi:DNA-binding PadR family transcriptional regulator
MTELLQGTLDLLILKAVSLGPLHGYGVLLRIQQISGDALANPAGLALSGAVPPRAPGADRFKMGRVGKPAPGPFYRLTAAGQRRLREEVAYWDRLSAAIRLALAAKPGDL